jgi:hypothetical protein
MPISLDDAVERAKLMADDSGLLAQEAYNLLLNSLEDSDRYAFTMALVDHGIISKQGSSERVRNLLGKPKMDIQVTDSINSDEYLANKFAKIAQHTLKAQYEIDEQGNPITSYGGTETSPFQETPEIDQTAVNSLRSVLENSGISISQDGKVSFYKSSVPGVYSDRLPQSMPLETASAYYQQVSRIAQSESEKADRTLNNLSRLSGQSEEISAILEDLKSIKFSQKSKSDFIVGISKSLESLVSTLSENANSKMTEYIGDLKDKFEQYKFDQEAKRDSYTQIAEALGQLQEVRESDPNFYNAVIKGLGGI